MRSCEKGQASGKADFAEEMGLDWTHRKETPLPGTELEPARKNRHASQQLEASYRGAAEAARLQLGKGSNNGPGPDGMAANYRWPMLSQEQWA